MFFEVFVDFVFATTKTALGFNPVFPVLLKLTLVHACILCKDSIVTQICDFRHAVVGKFLVFRGLEDYFFLRWVNLVLLFFNHIHELFNIIQRVSVVRFILFAARTVNMSFVLAR